MKREDECDFAEGIKNPPGINASLELELRNLVIPEAASRNGVQKERFDPGIQRNHGNPRGHGLSAITT